MKVSVQLDTKKLNDYVNALALRTSRELPVFLKRQSISLFEKIVRSLRTTQRQIKSRKKIDAFAARLSLSREPGVMTRKAAKGRAERKFGAIKKGKTVIIRERGRGRIEVVNHKGPNDKKLNIQQLRVRYELGIRRAGVGSVRAGFIPPLQFVDGKIKNLNAKFSKTVTSWIAPVTWVSRLNWWPTGVEVHIEHSGLKDKKVQRGIQRGVNRAATDMEKHFYNKTGDLLRDYRTPENYLNARK